MADLEQKVTPDRRVLLQLQDDRLYFRLFPAEMDENEERSQEV